MKASLKIYCQNGQTKWPEALQAFTFAINNLGSSALGGKARLCPHQMIFGRVLNTPSDVLQQKALYEPMDLMAIRLRAIAEAEQIVTRHREAAMRIDEEKGQAKYKHTEFNIGDTVLLYCPNIPVGDLEQALREMAGAILNHEADGGI